MKIATSKVSKSVTSKGGDASKSKSTKGNEVSKSKSGEATPRGFAQLHLQRLRKESEAIRSEARAMARLLGENEKTTALEAEFQSLSAEVSSLEALFKTPNSKEVDPSAWDAMQRALKKRHQAELSSLKTAAKLAGCKASLKAPESESDTSYASTPSTSPQWRCSEVDAGHVSDQSNNGASSDNSKRSTNQSTATPVSDEDSKSDEKGSELNSVPPTPGLTHRAGASPAGPQEEKVPQPKWAAPIPPPLKFEPPLSSVNLTSRQLDITPRSSIEDLDPFKSVLTSTHGDSTSDESDRNSYHTSKFAPKPRNFPETAPYQALDLNREVQWTPRVFNGEEQIVHTPPMSDDDLVAHPRDDPHPSLRKLAAALTPRAAPIEAALTPRVGPIEDHCVQETLEEAEFAMMHAKRAFGMVEARQRTPRSLSKSNNISRIFSETGLNTTPRNDPPHESRGMTHDKSLPNMRVRPPQESPPVPRVMPLAGNVQQSRETPLDSIQGDIPLTARSPPVKPLEASELAPPPLTARGPRQAEQQISRAQSFKQHCDEVLQRAQQTLDAFSEDRFRLRMPELNQPVRTPGYSPRQPSPPVSSLSPREPRPQVATHQVISTTQASKYNMRPKTPPHAAVNSLMRSAKSQQPMSSVLGSHSAPNVVRQTTCQTLPVSHFNHARSKTPAQIFGADVRYSSALARQVQPPLSASASQVARPWAFSRPL